jgi:hypothetical protein
MLEKGERVGLCAAGGLAVMLLALTLFMPGRGLFSGSASSHAEEINKLSGALAQKQANARPGAQHLPGEIKEVVDSYKPNTVDPTKYPTQVAFFAGQLRDKKRQMPVIFKAEEFQTAVVRAQLPALQFVPEDGKITKVWVLKSGVGHEAGAPGITMPANIGGNLQNLLKGGMGMGMGGPPGGMGGMGGDGRAAGGVGQHLRQAFQRGKQVYQPEEAKIEVVTLAAAQGRTPATHVLPLRMAIIEASFPYKQQVEEFRQKLRLETHGAVLSELVRGDKGQTLNSFQFAGLDVERMVLNPDGSDGKWEPLDLSANYNPLVIQTYRQFEPEKEELTPILQVSKRLFMRIPRQFKKGRYPDLESKLQTIQDTIKKLKSLDKKDVETASKLVDKGFDPFDVGAPAEGANQPTTPMEHPMGGDMGNPYGNIAGTATLKETPIDYCLIRFLDVSVEGGKAYKYRFKVKMVNPNYSPEPTKRKDTYVQFAREKILKSDWSVVPHVVAVPSDQRIYTVDQKNLDPRYPSLYSPNSNQVVFQIHRWVDFYRSPGASNDQAVGDWLAAPRFFVDRGEFVRAPSYRVQVPIKNIYHVKPELDTIPGPRPKSRTTWIPVSFGDDSILVDFEGGVASYFRSENVNESTRTTRIDDKVTTESLIMRSDGKLIAHNTVTDKDDPVRVKRYKDVVERIKAVKKGEKDDDPNPFGTN